MKLISSSDATRLILQRLKSCEIKGRRRRPKESHRLDPAADELVLAVGVTLFNVVVALGATVTVVGSVELLLVDTVVVVVLAGMVVVVVLAGTVVVVELAGMVVVVVLADTVAGAAV